jgi:hypothetical protein
LLEDFHSAIDDAIAKGEPYETFRNRFDEIVKRHGWSYNGSPGWRSRVIYETNLKTAYAAGRYKQMNEPAVKKAFPFWQYVHGLERVPDTPREEHMGWNGLILSADDDWWLTYYPPNGWKCGCGVRPVSRARLNRLDKNEPDPSPAINKIRIKDPATGDMINYPDGVDFGWAYAPGRTWADGLVPHELQRPLERQIELPGINDLTPLADISKPFKAPLLPSTQTDDFYSNAFLSKFGATASVPKLFRDKAGQVIVVSGDLFRDRTGKTKIKKRGREVHIARLAETIIDPDEIWVNWYWTRRGWKLFRSYLRTDEETNGFDMFRWSGFGWQGETAFQSKRNYIDNQRRGVLLYRRKK